MRYVTTLIAIAVLGVAPGAARADGVEISQQLYTRSGDPLLVANYSPNGALATPSWRACTSGVCGAVLATGNALEPGPTAAGTTFQASTTLAEVLTTDMSATWNGPLSVISPPTFTGEVRPGATVRPMPATWSGGWSGDAATLLGMRACPTLAGTGCRALSSSALQPAGWGSGPSVELGTAYEGWYVGAIETRVGLGAAFATIGLSFPPNVLSPWPAPDPGPTVAVGPLVGPMPASPTAPPSTPKDSAPRTDDLPRTDTAASKPVLTYLRRAKRQGNRLHLGTLRCTEDCRATVTAKQGQHKRSWTVKSGPKGRALTVATKRFPGRGRIRVTVRMSGQPTSSAWVRRR